jgi:hypothetical protein
MKKTSKVNKRPSATRVDTGGGAFVGGDVKAKKFVGRDENVAKQRVKLAAYGNRDELLAAIRDLHARVEALELESWEKEEIASNLKTAEKMVEAKEPPKDKLIDKLTATQKLLEAAKGSVEAAKGVGAAIGLTELAQRAGEAVMSAQQWLSGFPH